MFKGFVLTEYLSWLKLGHDPNAFNMLFIGLSITTDQPGYCVAEEYYQGVSESISSATPAL